MDLHKYCLKFLQEKGPDSKKEVLNAVIILLVKVVKICWFDDQFHQTIVNEIYENFNHSISHCFIGILTLEQILTEMTYINKGKTLIQNRRISVNFRDKCLLKVFNITVDLLKELQSKIVSSQGNSNEILTQALYHCLSLSHKCLNFEFIGIMLDETLAESTGTHFPLTWRDTMQNLDNTNVFNMIAMTKGLSEDSYILVLQCLAEFASCRLSLFETYEIRKQFTHNFATNMVSLVKEQGENFFQSRVLARELIKIFYKFEMNFQIRSFGIKEEKDLEVLVNYLSDLAELTLIFIKSGSQYLRDSSITLLAAWNRINIELKNQDVACGDQVREKIKEIVVQFLEQNISDLKPDDSEDDDEQFNETEINSLTTRFDMIARVCSIHIEDAFTCLNEGLSFLTNNYSEEGKQEIIENRMAWTIRVITSLINLGFSPKREDELAFTETPEYNVCIKTIEIIRITVELYMSEQKQVNEVLDMAILGFISTFRAGVLADPRVVAKVMDNDIDNAIHKSEGFIRVARCLEGKDILGIVEIFLKKMILTFFSNSEALVTQNLEMLKTFVSSPGTHRFLMILDTTKDLMENHFSKFVFLTDDEMLEYLSGFYKVLTILWEVNDVIDKFKKYMQPVSEFIENLLMLNASEFVQAKSDVLRVCYILNGVVQGFTSSESFNSFFDWFYPNHFKIIAEIFKHFSDDKNMLKGLFKLMRELLENKTHRLKAETCTLTGFLLFKEISSILLEYFKYVNMYEGMKIKKDSYEEKYQFIEIAVNIYCNIVSGNFINFAI